MVIANGGAKTEQSGPRLPTASERAYAEIRAKILNAELAPGHHVLEAELAAELGLSRTPVREACILLQADGLIEVIPRRGIRVVPVSPEDMADVYEILGTLEARAAELAAERGLSEAELSAFDETVAAMTAALEQAASEAGNADSTEDGLVAWAAADVEFHRLLVEASGNRRLAATALQFSSLVHRSRMVTLRLRPLPVGSTEDHRALVQAIRDGDGPLAHRLHLVHRRQTAASLVELLKRHRLVHL